MSFDYYEIGLSSRNFGPLLAILNKYNLFKN